MTPETVTKLVDLLKKQEGFRDSLYRCTAGHLTIGYGHNCDAHGDVESFRGRIISKDEATNLLLNDLADSLSDCPKNVRSFIDFSEIQQVVLVNMCFNMGIGKLLKFKNMLSAFILGDHKLIAREMINSKWAEQVGKRSAELVYMIFAEEFL